MAASFSSSLEHKRKFVDLHVSSKNRISPTGSSSSGPFTVRLAGPIDRVVEASLLEAVIPKTMYNIISGVNNRLDFNDGAVKSLTITPGAYDITTLCTTIQTAFNVASTNWTVTASATTFFVTIARSAGTATLLFASGANVAASIAPTLGFAATDLAAAATYTGTMVFNLVKPLSVFIVISEIGNSAVSSSSLSGFTYKVTMGGNYPGDVVVFRSQDSYTEPIPVHSRTLSTLTVSLCDDTGATVNLNGADWECFIRCFQA